MSCPRRAAGQLGAGKRIIQKVTQSLTSLFSLGGNFTPITEEGAPHTDPANSGKTEQFTLA